MAAGLIIIPNYMPALDGNGNPIAGAKLYFYINGTTTPTTVYADSGLTTPLTNPLSADNSGVFGSIYAIQGTPITVAVTDASGVPIVSYENIYASAASAYGAIIYTQAQSLSSGQQTQAQNNMAAPPATALARAKMQVFGQVDFSVGDFYTSYSEGSDGLNVYMGWQRNNSTTAAVGPNDRGFGATNLMIDSRTDRMNVTDGGFGVIGYFRDILEGGDSITTGYTGGRIGVLGQIVQNSLPYLAGYNNSFKVGANGQVITYTGDGGTDTGSGARGNYVGAHGIAALMGGAVNVEGVNGAELNIIVHQTASVKYATLLNLADDCAAEPSTAYYGVAMYRFLDSLGDVVGLGPRTWLAWSDIGGYAPVRANGTTVLMGGDRVNATGTWTVAQGIDLREFDITGAIVRGKYSQLTEDGLFLGSNTSGLSTISNASASQTNATLIISPKGTGALDLTDGAGNNMISVSTSGIGFNGTGPTAKPSISGSRNGNAALASLLTSLATMGLCTDTTTA